MASSTTHARARESAPDRIGPYEVLGRLATGGMAELLLARRVGIEGFQKVVVLKRILPMFARNPEFVEMFLHEARLAATLEHPNIVHVFDIGKTDDDYYFAMAYLHGKDLLGILRELIRRSERLPVVHIIAIACGVAAGLHHAHEQVGFDGQPLGIVHRDVSPANAIVTYDGSIKLVDFGIAKAAASANITRVGVRKGKAAYMSPEQCRGDALDPRSDIWSLGVVIYEMLTMARLYRADTDLAIMHRIVSQDVPPPSSLAPDVPPALEQIVMRCLARDRELRYANALDLQHALEACARTLGLGPSAGALGSFVRGLFGSPPLPWASGVMPAASSAPITGSLDVEIDSAPSEATRDLVSAPPPQLETAIGPPPSAPPRVTAPYPSSSSHPSGAGFVRAPASAVTRARPPRVLWLVGAAGVLLVAAGLARWQLSGDREPSPPAVPASAEPQAALATSVEPALPVTAPKPTPAVRVAAPTTAELEAWLAAVHQGDPARALPFATRHELLARLDASPIAARVDALQQTLLDLLQAEQSLAPCRTFGDALARLAELDRRTRPAAVDEALARARVPVPQPHTDGSDATGASCNGLEAQLVALRDEPTASVPTAAKTGRPRKPANVDAPRAAEPAPGRSTTPGAASRLDDELRPFHK